MDFVQEIMFDFDRFGFMEHQFPNAIGMWTEEQESLVWCCNNVDANMNWVEIGSFMGGSAVLMCLARQKLNNKPSVISVDIDFDKWNRAFDKNVYRVGKFNKIHKKIEKSSWSLTSGDLGPLSLAFIDGWHSFKGAYLDFKIVNQNMVKNGIVLFHDVAKQPYEPNAIDKYYQKYLSNKKELEEEVLPTGKFANDNEYFAAEKKQNFYLDEVVAVIVKEHDYEIVELPTIYGQTHWDRVSDYVHGSTSPYPSIVALRKTKD